jgi:hypothetical protein
MRVCTISWNGNSDVTKITFSQEFETSEWIVRADVLQDAIAELTDLYNHVLTKEARVWHEKNQKKPKKESVTLSTS